MKLLIAFVLGLLAVLLAADAQLPGKIPRIGVLTATIPTTYTSRYEAFRQGLRELGYVEGRTIAIEYRYAEGKLERLPAFAAELVRLKVDLIVAPTAPDTDAKTLGFTIPQSLLLRADEVIE